MEFWQFDHKNKKSNIVKAKGFPLPRGKRIIYLGNSSQMVLKRHLKNFFKKGTILWLFEFYSVRVQRNIMNKVVLTFKSINNPLGIIINNKRLT